MAESSISENKISGRRFRWKRYVLLVYAGLLIASHVFRYFQSPVPLKPGQYELHVLEVDGEKTDDTPVRFAYYDSFPTADSTVPVIVVLHGSPAASSFMLRLHRALSLPDTVRIITPDMPGFGSSTRSIPDYSVRAHARYLLQALDTLGIPSAHVVAYSMGGGIGLEASALAKERVASLSMLSAIGVQELELTGEYYLNHAVHALQLGGLWFLSEFTPHFGWMDDVLLGLSYARNFFDSDQRPLRLILSQYEGPLQILHGTDDFLVRYDVALEHERLVPQSELHLFQGGGHGLVMSEPDSLASLIRTFVRQAENGTALHRSDADPGRVRAASEPFDFSRIPPASGFNLFVLIVLIVSATLVSEDLASIGAGLAIARGTLTFTTGLSAAFAGIVVGDILLYTLGRTLGQSVVKRAPFKWMLTEDRLRRGSKWFAEKGFRVIVASRFIPGSRLPTYVAAGVLKAPFWQFLFYFLLASIVWTPILVGLSMILGNKFLTFFGVYESVALWGFLGLVISIYALFHIAIPALSRRGRRRIRSRWVRLTRWEFWPSPLFYIPVFFYVLVLAIRYRSLTLFTAANPGMPHGGFVGESKTDILEALRTTSGNVARFEKVDAGQHPTAAVRRFLEVNELSYPLVVKPDVGERGTDVLIAKTEGDISRYFSNRSGSYIIQEFVPGREYGVFYMRYPSAERGFIFSITDKRTISVTGDGSRTLEDLILDDDRANCMAPTHIAAHVDRLSTIPLLDEEVKVVEVGTHCRGALFLDGNHLASEALLNEIDRISREMPGFFFGRYDLKTTSEEDLKLGQNITIIELNGVTSEATDVYDPKNSLLTAYGILFRQWKTAFEIAQENRRLGNSPTRFLDLVRIVRRKPTE